MSRSVPKWNSSGTRPLTRAQQVLTPGRTCGMVRAWRASPGGASMTNPRSKRPSNPLKIPRWLTTRFRPSGMRPHSGRRPSKSWSNRLSVEQPPRAGYAPKPSLSHVGYFWRLNDVSAYVRTTPSSKRRSDSSPRCRAGQCAPGSAWSMRSGIGWPRKPVPTRASACVRPLRSSSRTQWRVPRKARITRLPSRPWTVWRVLTAATSLKKSSLTPEHPSKLLTPGRHVWHPCSRGLRFAPTWSRRVFS